MSQIITIKPDGSMFGLDHKNKGIQLKEFGPANTERVTLVEWDELYQRWTIEWFRRRNDTTWTPEEFKAVGLTHELFHGEQFETMMDRTGIETPVYFAEYEDAVAAEVAVIQRLQKEGKLTSNG